MGVADLPRGMLSNDENAALEFGSKVVTMRQLQRQYAAKYPGNLLAQPTLLLNPWDTTTAQSTRQLAESGDAMPGSPVIPLSDLMTTITPKIIVGEEREPSSSYEFLGKGAKLLANRIPDEMGWIEIPKEAFIGCHSLTVVVVQLQGVATKTIALPSTRIPLTELRLAKSFAEDKHLSQQHRVRVIDANQKSDLGDARSTRVQVYSTLQDVMRLYGTLLPSAEFQKFAKLSRWNQLKDEEKQANYNELACHELHVFLYLKDRPFFEKVVRPYLENKLAPQLIDEFLLDRDAAKFEDLWQQGRLNTFEKILLADRLQAAKPGVRKWIKDETIVLPGSLLAEHGESATNQLLDLPDPPTAIIAGGNQLLIGTLRVLTARGKRVGEDIALITCDDLPLTELYRPPIATISRDTIGIGRAAAQLLHARLQHAEEPATVMLPTTYRPRASASPAPKAVS